MIVLETERLYLRELVLEDVDALSLVLSDPESMKYYPDPYNREKVKSWIQRNIDNYRTYNHGLWAVVLKDGDIFIGDCGITMQNIDNEVLPEIGFHIIKDYWNKGYATEALTCLIEWALHSHSVDKIVAECLEDNIPSIKVLEKLNMTKTGKVNDMLYWQLDK